MNHNERREYFKAYQSKPENKLKIREYQKLWVSLPENYMKVLATKKRWREKPENKIKMLEYSRLAKNKERLRQYRLLHKEKIKGYQSIYSKLPKSKERQRIYTHNHDIKIKRLIMDKYGKFCQCCGENELVFLAIDHINGGGSQHRKQIGIGKLYRWIVKNNFPDGFQVLCMNCNWAKSHGGCPHKNLRLKDNKWRGKK